jgi:hypothetical protein
MFRRSLGINLMACGLGLIFSSILFRYATFAGRAVTNTAVTNTFVYWWGITITESWAWLAMFLVGLCILVADNVDRHTHGGPIG